MSNYTKATNFASKDSLLTGNPLKIVKGTEIDNEFNAISTAVSTKFDTASLAAPGPIGATTPAAINGTTGTFSGNVQIASQNGGQLAGLRNRVINGDMRIDQRQNGGSITITGAGVYTVDRFFSAATGANLTGNRTTTGTSSFGCTRATQFIGAASNTAAQLGQRIEAANLQDFDNGTIITISCYIYSSAAFTPTWQWITATTTDTLFSTVGASGSFAAVPATTWTRVTATFAAPANTTNGAQVTIQLGATLAGVTKSITGVQVELGPVATPFEQIPYGLSLQLCQRYYETIQYLTSSVISVCQATSATAASGFGTNFAVTKRSTPSVTYATGSANALTATGGNASGTILPSAPNVNNFNWAVTSASGLVAGNAVIINCASNLTLQASAEL